MNKNTQGLVGLAPRRKAVGYTQETFAEALGVSRSLLAAWEAGRVWPSARWLPVMAMALGCTIGALYIAHTDDAIVHQEGGDDHAGTMQESVL